MNGESGSSRRRPVSQWIVVLLGVLLALVALAGVVWGFEQTTWTYSSRRVDAATTQRLLQLQEELQAAGAPEAAVAALARAARPGIHLGDAVEALALAGEALERDGADERIAALRLEVGALYRDLYGKEYWWQAAATPESLLPR